MNVPVLILAGGLGTRMRPMTDMLPKCLLPVKGRPFLLHQLKWLHSWGLRDITISVGYRAAQVRQAVEGQRVRFQDDDTPEMGTAGAIRQFIHEQELTKPFVTLYGDVCPRHTPFDILDAYPGGKVGVVGRNGDLFDLGFNLLVPGMQRIVEVELPRPYEIGSWEGYREAQWDLPALT